MSTDAGGSSQMSFVDMVQSIKDQTDAAVAIEYGKAGVVDGDGEFDGELLADKLFPLIAKAVATKTSERAAVCVRRRELVQHVFPNLPGPENFTEQPNPLLAQKVYSAVDSACWRTTNPGPDGRLQQRMNGEHALVLCRTQVNPDKADAVYVTRDRGCLVADLIKPQSEKQKARANREAALMEMLIQRIPEHGPRFHRDLKGGLQRALDSATAITAAAVEALDGVEDDELVVEDAE